MRKVWIDRIEALEQKVQEQHKTTEARALLWNNMFKLLVGSLGKSIVWVQTNEGHYEIRDKEK